MRYVFSYGSDGNLDNAANWTPAGGPPGAGDTAVFKVGPRGTETLEGTASVGALEFYGGEPGTLLNGSFVLDNVTLDAAMALGAQFVDCFATAENSTLTTGLLHLSGGQLDFAGGSLQTDTTTIASTAGSGWDAALSLGDSTWTNTGSVVLRNSPESPSPGFQIAELNIEGSTVTIGGDLTAFGGDYNAGIYIADSSVAVAGDVVLSGAANLEFGSGAGGGVMRIGGNLLVNAHGAATGGFLDQAFVGDGTIDVAGDIVAGAGGHLFASTDGVLRAEGAIRLLDGALGTIAPDGTIETNTMVLQSMAFLSGPSSVQAGGPAVIEGLGGGTASICNQGTIGTQNPLTIDGNVAGHGTLLLSQFFTATGDMTVNGTVTGQAIRFGAPGSQFFAQDFGPGDAVVHFLQGDTLATPDIASIGFDAASNTLTIDKQSGAVERVAMHAGDLSGQTFTLTDHEFITLQPATA